MFIATSKKLLAAGLMALSLVSCSDKERDGASRLVSEADAAIENRNFSGAITLLDTLNTRYPSQTEIRRKALRLRAQAMEGIAIDSIQSADAALAEATIRREELDTHFRHVDSNVGLEGYFIPKGAPEKVMTTTGIQPRVSEKGFFYIVANVQGRSIGLSSIEFVDGATSVSSAEISPARVIKVEGSESASFNPEDLEGVGEWLSVHPGASKLVLKGSKGSVNVKVDDKMRTQLAECFTYSKALQSQRLASLHREKYERMLATARDQLANLPQSEVDNK